jgi:glycosyltransferase involved in cell wall biosynthesis
MELELAWLAEQLRVLGHEVAVACKPGSTIEPPVYYGESEDDFIDAIRYDIDNWDVIIDFSHDKSVGQKWSDMPQINTHQVMVIQHDINPVFISEAQRQHCGRLDAPVIYYGQDQSMYPLFEGPRLNYILYMGSLIAEKRPHWVAELSLKTGIPAVICGPRWQAEYWPTLDEISEWDKVTVGESVGGSEKIELLQHAKALVHPIGGQNWVEAGAIVVLEALACGTPVIAYPNGCLPEYISHNHNGFLANSKEEMELCLQRVDQIPPSRCRLSVQNFTHTRMAKEYSDLAAEVLNGKRW